MSPKWRKRYVPSRIPGPTGRVTARDGGRLPAVGVAEVTAGGQVWELALSRGGGDWPAGKCGNSPAPVVGFRWRLVVAYTRERSGPQGWPGTGP